MKVSGCSTEAASFVIQTRVWWAMAALAPVLSPKAPRRGESQVEGAAILSKEGGGESLP